MTPRPDALSDAELALGIDLGGTKNAGGLVETATGRVVMRLREPTDLAAGSAAVLAQVEAMTQRLIAAADGRALAGLGLGVPELVSPTGQIFSGYNFDWRDLDAQDRLSRIIPTRIEADVRAAALAEARFGAGRGQGDFLFVTIGTGISAVLVRDGQPYAGSRGAALVLASGRTRQHCPACGKISEYVLEEEAAGPGLVRAYVAAGGRATGAEEVISAATAGDTRAQEIVALATLRLGQAVAMAAGLLDPAVIVVGGGLGSAPGPYFDALCREIRAGLWTGDDRDLPVLRAALGPDAGLIGAGLIGAKQIGTAPQNT